MKNCIGYLPDCPYRFIPGDNTHQQVLAFKKAGGRLALSLYVFLPTACFHFKLLELVHVDLF